MPDVATIICAYNAAPTIGRAVTSALAEPEVSEVVVVDDASTDDSAGAARAKDDGSGRLHVVRLPANVGPAAARNIAFDHSQATHLAILDADDFLLPGRFAAMLRAADWDMVADNILFVREDAIGTPLPAFAEHDSGSPTPIDLASFVKRNISSRAAPRGELGFLKPLIRRAFLQQTGLRYDEALRLGEDYALYCRALAAGARFGLIDRCGYVAIERAGSLSGAHRTADLFALAASDASLLAQTGLDTGVRQLIEQHRAQLLAKAHHRLFLDKRHAVGMARATLSALAQPARFFGIARDIAIDKLSGLRRVKAGLPMRMLFDVRHDH